MRFHYVEKENYLLKPCVGQRPQLTIYFFHTHFNIIILETNYDPLNSAQFLTLMYFNIRIYFNIPSVFWST